MFEALELSYQDELYGVRRSLRLILTKKTDGLLVNDYGIKILE